MTARGWSGRYRLAMMAALLGALSVVVLFQAIRGRTADEAMADFLSNERIPGAVLAMDDGRGNRFVRAYGLADPASGRRVETDTPFRLASLSKPITAAAVRALVAGGRLGLDDHLLAILNLPAADVRASRITIRHLLSHRAGWKRTSSFDPLLDDAGRRKALGRDVPGRCPNVAHAMLDLPLDFEPGTAEAYSNLGYCFLQLVIERVSGRSYADFVTEAVLRPAGAGGVKLGEKAFDRNAPATPQAGMAGDRLVEPLNAIGRLGAAGGWVGTADGMLAFLASVDPRWPVEIPPFPSDKPYYYGLGWRVWPLRIGADLTHFGALPGTFAFAMRTRDGYSIVALFNARPGDDEAAFERLRKLLPLAARSALEPG